MTSTAFDSTADTQTGVAQGIGKPGDAAVNVAVEQLGIPYNQQNPQTRQTGFDCAGLLQYCYLNIGSLSVDITRTTSSQWSAPTMTTICDAFGGGAYGIPTSVTESDLELGDCLYYFSPGNSGNQAHAMMYVGGGQCIQAPYTGQVIGYTPLQFVSAASDEPFRGVRRVTGGGSPSGQVGASGQGTGNSGGGSNNSGLTVQQMQQMAKKIAALKDPRSNLPFSAAFMGQAFGGQLGDFRFTPNKRTATTLMPATQLVRGGMMELVAKQFKVYFMMNPQQISAELAMNQQQLNPFQVSGDYFQSGGYWVANQSISFTLYFNRMYEVWQNNIQGPNGTPGPSGEGCRWDTRAVERLMGIFDPTAAGDIGLGNNGWGAYPASMQPVQVVFGGPNTIQFQGYISSLDYTYTIFDVNMIPVECYVDVGVMRVYNPSQSGADLTAGLVTSTGQVGPQQLTNGQLFTK